MPQNVADSIGKVSFAFELAKRLPADEEIQGEYARHLCVLVSGLIENCVRIVLSNFCSGKAHPFVADFATNQLDGFQNAKFGKIVDLVRQFSGTWADQLESNTDETVRGHVDSVVARRHLIAHGRDAGISIGTVKQYFESSKNFVNLLQSSCA